MALANVLYIPEKSCVVNGLLVPNTRLYTDVPSVRRFIDTTQTSQEQKFMNIGRNNFNVKTT